MRVITYDPNDNDEELLQKIFDLLNSQISASAYADDGLYAEQVRRLPRGLRAMAPTHWLDVSLTLDDICWHFRNFGEENQVHEAEAGLRELGLDRLADLFHEAYELIKPYLDQANENDTAVEYEEYLEKEGLSERVDELARKAWDCLESLGEKNIYPFWVKYARAHPEWVFVSEQPSLN